MSTVTILSTAPPASTIVEAPVNATTPPIVYFFQLALGILSTAYSATLVFFSSAWSLSKAIFSPIRSLVSAFSTPLLYILAPVIVLGRILLEVLVLAPYSLVTGVAREVYPIYVFVGAACIWAAFIGFCARGVTSYMQLAMFGSENLVSIRTGASPAPHGSPKKKSAKKVTIKEEEQDVRPDLR